MNLRIRSDGSVRMSAPYRVPRVELESFVRERQAWIEAQLSRIRNRGDLQEALWSDGALVSILGKPYTLRLLGAAVSASARRVTRLAWIDGERLNIGISPEATASEVRQAVIPLVKPLLRAQVERIFSAYEPLMNVRHSKLSLREMTSRWGSCNVRTARICLNLALVHYPVSVIRYIIIHELTHLHEPSHNARFHTLMEKFCPEWREARRTLRNETILS